MKNYPRRWSTQHKSLVWTHLRRIDKHVPDHEINEDCSHVCVYPLSDDEDGVIRYYNTVLKLFRTTKTSDDSWNTTSVVTHSKKIHEDSVWSHNHKGSSDKLQSHT
jgi:hypothetical protein